MQTTTHHIETMPADLFVYWSVLFTIFAPIHIHANVFLICIFFDAPVVNTKSYLFKETFCLPVVICFVMTCLWQAVESYTGKEVSCQSVDKDVITCHHTDLFCDIDILMTAFLSLFNPLSNCKDADYDTEQQTLAWTLPH